MFKMRLRNPGIVERVGARSQVELGLNLPLKLTIGQVMVGGKTTQPYSMAAWG